MDAMYWLMLVSRVLHILGAIVLVGGVFYLRAIVAPAASADTSTAADGWFAGRRAAWARWVGIATLVLLITGVFNFVRIVQINEPLGGAYHAIFGIKFLLAFVVFVLAAMLAGRSFVSDNRKMTRWLSVCLAVGVLTVALGGVLRSVPHVPTPNSMASPLLIQPNTGEPTG